MSEIEVVGLGCLGGALPDILRAVKLRYQPAPQYLRRWFFWISLAVLVVMGGVVTHFVHPESAVAALSVGFSAPELLSKLLGAEVPQPPAAEGKVWKLATDPRQGTILQQVRRWWLR